MPCGQPTPGDHPQGMYRHFDNYELVMLVCSIIRLIVDSPSVSVIPELLEGKTSLWQTIKELIAMLTGIGLMIFIAAYE